MNWLKATVDLETPISSMKQPQQNENNLKLKDQRVTEEKQNKNL